MWDLATLYRNDSNPLLQGFKLRGRYQGQYDWLNSDQGDAGVWENRRSRFGFDAKLFAKKIELRFDAESNDGFDPLYAGLVDAYVKWKPSPAFALTLGRQKPQIGAYDWLESTLSNNKRTVPKLPSPVVGWRLSKLRERSFISPRYSPASSGRRWF